jgi:hypothetical protein
MANIVKEWYIKAKVALKCAVRHPPFPLEEGNYGWKHSVQPHPYLSSVSSIIPKIGEPMRGQSRVANGILNVAMPQVVLDRTGINAFISQIKTAGMPQHVRMNRKRKVCDLSCPKHNMPNRSVGQRPATLRHK